MKKLICEQDIKLLAEKGETCCQIDKNTVVTPSARDAADAAGISFCCGESAPAAEAGVNQLTPELIRSVVEGLIARGRLPADFCERLMAAGVPYCCEQDESGLKIVRGNTIRMDELLSGNPRVRYQRLTDKAGAAAGILEIDHDTYQRTKDGNEIAYVLEGSLTVTIKGNTYSAGRGDCLFVPGNISVTMSSLDACCRMLCLAYQPDRAVLT